MDAKPKIKNVLESIVAIKKINNYDYASNYNL